MFRRGLRRVNRDETDLLLVSLLRQQCELHSLLLRLFFTVEILLHFLSISPNHRETDVERDRFSFRYLSSFGSADHHLGEFASKVVFFILSHGVRITTSRFASLLILFESVTVFDSFLIARSLRSLADQGLNRLKRRRVSNSPRCHLQTPTPPLLLHQHPREVLLVHQSHPLLHRQELYERVSRQLHRSRREGIVESLPSFDTEAIISSTATAASGKVL